MTIRAAMTEEHRTPDEISIPTYEVQEQVDSNGVASENTSETPSPTAMNTIRSRGLKVSNLRAAFEQSGDGAESRSLSNERRVVSSGRGLETEVAKLKDALAKEQELTEAEKQRVDSLQAEIVELRKQLSDQQNQQDKQESRDVDMEGQTNNHVDSQQLEVELQSAKAQARMYEDEVSTLRSQLSEMKRSISTNTRVEGHEMTDSALQEDFGTLCYLVQDWVINSYRKVKIEKTAADMCSVVDSLDEQHRRVLRPLFQHWESTSKLVFLQAATVSLLLPVFEASMPYGLSGTDAKWPEAVQVAAAELQHVLDNTAYSRWRATTCDIICHSELISPLVDSAAEQIARTICTTIDQVCGVATAETQMYALHIVVKRVIALSHMLRGQRASYELELPLPGAALVPDRMEEISHEFEDLPDRNIQCAVFPAVFKHGPGRNRALIFKARVS